MSKKYWEVIGGFDTGGILVRTDKPLSSPQSSEGRLQSGAVVRELQLDGDRLQYRIVKGEGPSEGWVSVKVRDKPLLARVSTAHAQRAMMEFNTVLPTIRRKRHCPGISCLPPRLRKKYPNADVERKPKLYVFAFTGAADTVRNGWVQFECDAPSHVEVATYEWPAHMERQDEPMASTLEELSEDAFVAFEAAMEAGPFVVVGHSNGVRLMTLVCKLAQDRLSVAPQLAVVLDTGAMHIPVYSDHGIDMLINDPERFCQIYAFDTYEMRNVKTSTAYANFINDQKLGNDTRPIGWYKFPCLVHVWSAAYDSFPTWPPEGAPEEWIQEYEKLLRPSSRVVSPFNKSDYDSWSEWAEQVEVHHTGYSHHELKNGSEWKDTLWQEIDKLLCRT